MPKNGKEAKVLEKQHEQAGTVGLSDLREFGSENV